MSERTSTNTLDDFPLMSLSMAIGMLLSVLVGALGAMLLLPNWLPGLASSLVGEGAQAYWYISRSSAFVAYILLWAAVTFGLLISNKMARIWPGGPLAFELHQHISILGLAFALLHALILLGDRYIQYDLRQVLVPFASTAYRTNWVGLGQLGFYLVVIVIASFYLRKRLGNRAWRLTHTLSYAAFLLVTIHGWMSGTDSETMWAKGIYWIGAGSVLFLFVYRLLVLLHKTSSNVTSRTS